ncbi:MAG: hypothetical protein KAJ56_00015 [Candidatus Aenigmarchaeota archaeon]|nr:hypothetical protein [Candidatus Aenigmarchaeota archaeon]MCK5234930.1 hypothetical protein [Candidatus Aenigmarchaeota archaeon]MCK5289302.1 hypothetical protein [Candidatus Aenigmarchaeota archaeon]
MRLGTEMLENFLVICIMLMTISAFLILGGGMLNSTLLAVSITNMLLLLVVGALYFNAIILLRVYKVLSNKKR